MDINRVSNEKKLNLCTWYFRAGFAFLPFVWVINVIWFFDSAVRKPPFEEQNAIRKYVILSAIGSFIWIIIIATWVSLFQANRIAWGSWADDLSFIIPLGSK
ncbi:CLUMA_CG007011, isoform A [Clunio marinus]|uniref:Gamma-secretase subunit PEN-2 n=1 Tax=Clunio marinus TaxID=568069 RepID=A0A1J1HZT4_9DIPT|nr:CLUMA_CG007011, isoform A [Clunio marinus]